MPVEDAWVEPERRCVAKGCEAVRLGDLGRCLEHASARQFERYVRTLTAGDPLDLRSTRVPHRRLSRILQALKAEVGHVYTIHRVGAASFQRAVFEGGLFLHTTFDENASFEGAKGSVSFSVVRFAGDANFDSAVLKGSFEDVIFNLGASFERAVFAERQQWFERTCFYRSASFENATFENASRVGPLLAEWLYLDEARFEERVVIEAAAGGISAVRTEFRGGVALRLRHAELALDSTAMNQSCSVSLAPYFEYHSELEGQLVDAFDESAVEREDADPRPRLASLRHADVNGLVLHDVDLSSCLFTGVINLDRIRIEGARAFAYPPKAALPLWRWTRRQTLAEEHTWRLLGNDPLARKRRGTWWAIKHGGWRWDIDPPLWVVRKTGERAGVLQPERIAPLYRALRKAQEDSKDEPGAGDFYYGEMEMRRLTRANAKGERLILFLYWLTSGYGQRGSRALACLVAVIAVSSVLLQHAGFVHPRSLAYSLVYTAQATLSIQNRIPLTLTGDALLIFLRLSGPLFLGLALLSVRNRVKR